MVQYLEEGVTWYSNYLGPSSPKFSIFNSPLHFSRNGTYPISVLNIAITATISPTKVSFSKIIETLSIFKISSLNYENNVNIKSYVNVRLLGGMVGLGNHIFPNRQIRYLDIWRLKIFWFEFNRLDDFLTIKLTLRFRLCQIIRISPKSTQKCLKIDSKRSFLNLNSS